MTSSVVFVLEVGVVVVELDGDATVVTAKQRMKPYCTQSTDSTSILDGSTHHCIITQR